MNPRLFSTWVDARWGILVTALALATPSMTWAADSSADTIQFNRDVRPILAGHCFACHGMDSAARTAGLRLDIRDDAVAMGAFNAGSADDSEMISRIFSDDAEMVMPPPESKKPLSDQQKQTLVDWINQGAMYEPHWSLILPQRTELTSEPTTDDQWSRNQIDRFVYQRLQEVGLEPSPEAEPHELIRRLYLDITGLPPAPENVAQFISDYEADGDVAVDHWVDRLMDDPAWGEHRARYWLDAARYADTHGMHFDNYREMWPYRDWVIRALNANMPFDQFVVEQLAGDLLPNPSEDQLIATGFQRCNMTTNEGGTIDDENLAMYATDRVQTFGWVFLGLTTNCAQCHDHKFDPISAKDYYSLAAFFRNQQLPAKDGNSKDGAGPTIVVPHQDDRERWHALPDLIQDATAALASHKANVEPKFRQWMSSFDPQSTFDHRWISDVAATFSLSAPDVDAIQTQGKVEFEATQQSGFTTAMTVDPSSFATAGDVADFGIGDPFSVSAWIRPHKNSTGQWIAGRVNDGDRGWALTQDNRRLDWHMADLPPSNMLRVRTQGDVIEDGKWAHVAVSYDGSGGPSGIRFHVDGVEQPSEVVTNTIKPNADLHVSDPLTIAGRANKNSYIGLMHDLTITSSVPPAWQWSMVAASVTMLDAMQALPPTPVAVHTLRSYYLNGYDKLYRDLNQTLEDLTNEQIAIRNRSPVTHVQRERESMAMTNILMRGEYDQVGEEVTAAPPAALHPMPAGAPANRLGLAQWVIDPANPLTARVTVNRYWQQVFGRGLVSTPEDFGVTGMLPTHPRLLDHLALQFIAEDWDIKAFFKSMLTSSTYRQTAIAGQRQTSLDNDNALLSRGPRYRMDAEMIRDGALASSGLLSKQMYGPGVKPYQPTAIWDVVGLPGGDTRNYVTDSGHNLYRRTLYSFWKRMAPPPSMEILGAPNREVCTVQRERTNTPMQALVTLNDPQFVEAARVLASNVVTENRPLNERLDTLAARLLSRGWSDEERLILTESLNTFEQHYDKHADAAKQLIAIGQTQADPSIDASELAAWTMLCNELLNLDEVLTK